MITDKNLQSSADVLKYTKIICYFVLNVLFCHLSFFFFSFFFKETIFGERVTPKKTVPEFIPCFIACIEIQHGAIMNIRLY